VNDKDDLEMTDSFVPAFHFTRQFEPPENTSQSEQETEEPELMGATTAVKIYRFVTTRVSWAQRVLGWFRKN